MPDNTFHQPSSSTHDLRALDLPVFTELSADIDDATWVANPYQFRARALCDIPRNGALDLGRDAETQANGHRHCLVEHTHRKRMDNDVHALRRVVCRVWGA